MGVGGRGIIRPTVPGFFDGTDRRLDQLERPVTSSTAALRPKKTAVGTSWLMAGSGAVTPTTGAFTAVAFTFTGDFPTVGSAFSWAIGTPTEIVVNSNVFAAIRVSVVASGANACVVDMHVDLNGNSAGPFQYDEPFADYDPAVQTSGIFLGASYPATPMAAGDVLKLMVRTSDGAHATAFTDALFVISGS